MIYTYSTEKKYSPHQSKFIEVENNSRDAVELFLSSKLRDSDIVGKMDLNENANPNKKFEIFIDNFTKLKQLACLENELDMTRKYIKIILG